MHDIDSIRELLQTTRRIAITTHAKPDGDAIGSSMALYHYLRKKGHKVDVVTPTVYADFLKWLPDNDKVLVGPEDPDRAGWIFEGADIIFCLDFNGLSRINDLERPVKDAMGKRVMIDHHLDPQPFFDLAYWDPQASSTAELVYRLIGELGDHEHIDLPIAQAIYMGVLTDTGSFRFSNTSPAVHRMVAHLMEIGVDVNEIYDSIFNQGTVTRLQFLGHCLSECLTILPELKTAYFKVPREVFRKYNVRVGDTEGLVNYALSIRDINLAVLMTQQDDLTKLSFRSRGTVSSAALAEQFNGGGHFYAAGGRLQATPEDTEKKLLELLEASKEQLVS